MAQYFKVSKRIEELAKGVDSATNKQLYSALKQYKQLETALTKLYKRNFKNQLAALEKEQADLMTGVRSFNPLKYYTAYKGNTPATSLIDATRLDAINTAMAKRYMHLTHMDIFFSKEEQERILQIIKTYIRHNEEKRLQFAQNRIAEVLNYGGLASTYKYISVGIKSETPDIAWMTKLNPALKTSINAADIYRYKTRIRTMQKGLASITNVYQPFLHRYNTPEMDVDVLSKFYEECGNFLQAAYDGKTHLTQFGTDLLNTVNSLDTTVRDAAVITAEYNRIFNAMQQEMSQRKLGSDLRTLYKASGGQQVKSSFSAVELKNLTKQLDVYKKELQELTDEIDHMERVFRHPLEADSDWLKWKEAAKSKVDAKQKEIDSLDNILHNSPLSYTDETDRLNESLVHKKKAIAAKLVLKLEKLSKYMDTAISYNVKVKAQIESINNIKAELAKTICTLKSTSLTARQLYFIIQDLQLTLDRLSKTFIAPTNADGQIKVLLSMDELLNLDSTSILSLKNGLTEVLGKIQKNNRHYRQAVKAGHKHWASMIQTKRALDETGEDRRKRAEQAAKLEKQRSRHERIEQLSKEAKKRYMERSNERLTAAVNALSPYALKEHLPIPAYTGGIVDVNTNEMWFGLAQKPVKNASQQQMYNNMPTLAKWTPEQEKLARELAGKKPSTTTFDLSAQTKARTEQIYEMMEQQAAQAQAQMQAQIQEQSADMPEFLEKKSNYSYEDVYKAVISQIFFYFVQLLGLYTPTDSGNLIDSFEYKLGDTYFKAWFDMKKAPYAVRQHEETTYNHPTGCAKFMEKAIWQAVGAVTRGNSKLYVPVFMRICGYTEAAKTAGAHINKRFTNFINETGTAGPELSVTVGLTGFDNLGPFINAEPGRYSDILSPDNTDMENWTQLVGAQRIVKATSDKINELKQLLGISSKDIDQNMINHLLYNRQLNYKWADKFRQMPRQELIEMCRGFVATGHATEAIAVMITVDKLAPRRMAVVGHMSQLANTARR